MEIHTAQKVLNFGSAKKLCLICFLRQKHSCKYFAFNQSYLVKGKIAPAVLLPLKVKIAPVVLLPLMQNKKYGFSWEDQEWISVMIFKKFSDQKLSIASPASGICVRL